MPAALDRWRIARVRTLSGFIVAVDRLRAAWNKDVMHQFDPWFRGQANASWHLAPSIYRERAIWEYGDAHLVDFKLKAHAYLSGVAETPQNDLEWYCLMQHYGLPTRLIDWTEGALLALYFAVRDSLNIYPGKDEQPDACVWVLNPWAFNSRVGKRAARIMFPDSRGVIDYATEGKRPPPRPIAIAAPLKSRRIVVQKGVFTLHGNLKRGIDQYKELRGALARIDIAASRIDSIRRSLLAAGITETTVFPELSGLARELHYYWRDEY